MYKLLALCLVIGVVGPAHANGRDPGTVSIVVHPTDAQRVIVGSTFGLTLTTDGGATWQWMCEAAVGYGGTYDPDYALTAQGTIFATTFDGLRVMRAGETCGFSVAASGTTFISRIDVASDGTMYTATVAPDDSNIYKSTDDGMTFPTSAQPGMPGDWWSSILTAPQTPQRVYLSGYRLVGSNRQYMLFTSADGGASFTPMTTSGISPTSMNSSVDFVGVSSTSDQTAYVRVSFETGTIGDSIYRTTDGGQSWTKILSKASAFGLVFLARKDGSCVAATKEQGAWVSTDCATAATPTWTLLPNAPHIGCLTEDFEGNVWACTQNYESMAVGLPSDGFGVMRSSDLSTWTGVLRFQDIQAPVNCPAGTLQEDRCVQQYLDQDSAWCCLVTQFNITSTAIDCTGSLACGTVMPVIPDDPGCCGTGSGASTGMLSGIAVGLLVLRRRRPRRRQLR